VDPDAVYKRKPRSSRSSDQNRERSDQFRSEVSERSDQNGMSSRQSRKEGSAEGLV
jgi:hypothetical protein